ncbi:MAG: serine/threonine-protein kinase [Polyangia bacterium]
MFPEGHRLGAYRIVRMIGEGGMGAVYEARHETLERRVALKTLRPDYARNHEAVARFFNEAKVLSRLEHPCIVQVSDFGQTEDDVLYLVMEFLRGEPLSRRLRKLAEQNQRLPVPVALQMAWQIADVLSVAHSQGIVHRDLKPDNLMLVADPIAPGGERVKLLDFGIAKLTSDERGAVKTDTHSVMGTPMYMSPEQCAGAGGVDAKTDVYSLGCVLYETLAGRPPFIGVGSGELIGQHLFQVPPSLASLVPKLPSPVSSLVHRMLEKDKTKRLRMSDAADEIGRLLSKMSGSGPLVRSLPPAPTDPETTKAVGIPALSTTLGQLTGQRTDSSRKLARRLAIATGLAALGVTVFLVRARDPSPRRTDPAPNAAATPAAAASVRWHIATQPANAAVLDEAGRTLGHTPWTRSAPAAPGKRSLRLHVDGYSEVEVSVEESADFEQTFLLEPLATSPPTPPPKRNVSASPAKPAVPPSPAPPKTRKIGYED